MTYTLRVWIWSKLVQYIFHENVFPDSFVCLLNRCAKIKLLSSSNLTCTLHPWSCLVLGVLCPCARQPRGCHRKYVRTYNYSNNLYANIIGQGNQPGRCSTRVSRGFWVEKLCMCLLLPKYLLQSCSVMGRSGPCPVSLCSTTSFTIMYCDIESDRTNPIIGKNTLNTLFRPRIISLSHDVCDTLMSQFSALACRPCMQNYFPVPWRLMHTRALNRDISVSQGR
jgi:hypothetical protein